MRPDREILEKLWDATVTVLKVAVDNAENDAELMTILTCTLVYAASRDEKYTLEHVIAGIRASWEAKPPAEPQQYDA